MTPTETPPTAIERVIGASARNKFLVVILVVLALAAGLWALRQTPLDAIPDLSDVQVIITADWEGRSPDLVEDQITYPLSTRFIAVPRVKFVRGESMFGKSFVYVIFEDGTDIYWARSRVIEYLNSARGSLPDGVNPVIGPDATGVGWVYEYALVDESGKNSLADLRGFQDWHLRYALESVKGVAEVAPVGGFVKEYQVDLDPNKLLAYGVALGDVVSRIRQSNNDVGGRIFEVGRSTMCAAAATYGALPTLRTFLSGAIAGLPSTSATSGRSTLARTLGGGSRSSTARERWSGASSSCATARTRWTSSKG
jgi:Cu(I)/Ag(I) efflux system membrane protein CusA/SilA